MMLNINNMSDYEIRSYYEGYVRRLEQVTPANDDEEQFIALQKRILSELNKKNSLYKVSTIDTTREHLGGLLEHNTMYFTSQRTAKRELKKRVKSLLSSPLVAAPDEVMELGVNTGVAPSLVQSVVTNRDLKKNPPGRFKLYEVRMLAEGRIVPVQIVMSRVQTSDHQLRLDPPMREECKIIPFPKILR